MGAHEFANRLLGLQKSSLAARGDSATPGAPQDAGSYVYGDSAAGIFSIYFLLPTGDPQQGAVWLAQVAFNFGGGVGFFDSAVSFQDGSVQRTGWIYQFALGSSNFAIYFPDYIDEATGCYLCAETTLPYTPGQPPAGWQDGMPLRRSPG